MVDEGFRFEGIAANTPKNVEYILTADPNEPVMLMSPTQFKKWRTKIFLLSWSLSICCCSLGIIIGYLIWHK